MALDYSWHPILRALRPSDTHQPRLELPLLHYHSTVQRGIWLFSKLYLVLLDPRANLPLA